LINTTGIYIPVYIYHTITTHHTTSAMRCGDSLFVMTHLNS
jgi:hypothetical protein